MSARKIVAAGTAPFVLDLGEDSRDRVGRVAVHVITAGGATWTATFRATMDPAGQALGTASPQVGYVPRKSGTYTDGATAVTDALAGAEAIYDVYADGGHVGMHFSAFTPGGGSVTLLVRPVAG